MKKLISLTLGIILIIIPFCSCQDNNRISPPSTDSSTYSNNSNISSNESTPSCFIGDDTSSNPMKFNSYEELVYFRKFYIFTPTEVIEQLSKYFCSLDFYTWGNDIIYTLDTMFFFSLDMMPLPSFNEDSQFQYSYLELFPFKYQTPQRSGSYRDYSTAEYIIVTDSGSIDFEVSDRVSSDQEYNYDDIQHDFQINDYKFILSEAITEKEDAFYTEYTAFSKRHKIICKLTSKTLSNLVTLTEQLKTQISFPSIRDRIRETHGIEHVQCLIGFEPSPDVYSNISLAPCLSYMLYAVNHDRFYLYGEEHYPGELYGFNVTGKTKEDKKTVDDFLYHWKDAIVISSRGQETYAKTKLKYSFCKGYEPDMVWMKFAGILNFKSYKGTAPDYSNKAVLGTFEKDGYCCTVYDTEWLDFVMVKGEQIIQGYYTDRYNHSLESLKADLDEIMFIPFSEMLETHYPEYSEFFPW